MAAPNRWAVREAAEATFFDTVTGDAIVSLKTLKMSNVETTGETVYARGGRGNAKLVGFSSNREAKVTLQDAIFDNKALAMLTGNSVTTGTNTVTKQFQGMTDGTGKITIAGATIASVVSIHPVDTDGLTIGIAAVNTNDATSVTAASLVSQLVRVYYKEVTAATAKTVKVTSDKFGGTFKLVVDVIVKSEETGAEHYAQFIAERVKIEDTFSFNFSPDGDPSVLDIPLEILKNPANTDMWQLVIY
jgi:hypothetical protein